MEPETEARKLFGAAEESQAGVSSLSGFPAGSFVSVSLTDGRYSFESRPLLHKIIIDEEPTINFPKSPIRYAYGYAHTRSVC